MISKIGQPQHKINSSINQRLNANLDFSKVLEQAQNKADLKISAHALDRLRERNISLTDKDISTLKTAVENLRLKGGREALILYKNVAYITSVKNNTIITAVDSENLKENVFTNIDSAVIV